MHSWNRNVAIVIVFAGAFLLSSPAEAKGFFLITYGEKIVDVGVVAEEHREAMREEFGADPSVGFIHNGFGLFWLNIWTWDGRYCAYQGDQYMELEPQQAAMLLGVPLNQLRKPIFYRFPPGLLILIVIVAIYATHKFVTASKEKKLSALFEDPRYKRALNMISERVKQAEGASETEGDQESAFDKGLEDGVAYLAGEGIPEAEGRSNLATMVNIIVQSRQEEVAQT